ncbi:MAG: hypothetical protein LBN18_05255 [Dysgonamonadaceae bacterium]|nr:hypothetical protein [Dysgonamonadaceae bacterium]
MQRQILLLLVVFLPLASRGQSFSGKSIIPEVEESGYYHILLSPDVIALSQENLQDIRIKNDRQETDIPFLLRSEYPKNQSTYFQNYTIEENIFHAKDSLTRIIVDNEAKEEIRQFCISIRNAEITKYISLQGSDDKKTWYVVKEKFRAKPGIKNDENSEMLIVDFPQGNYRYYEIRMSNLQKDPIQILNVGKYRYSETLGKYTKVEIGSFVQKDSSDTKTYLILPTISRRYLVNRIHFEIDSKQPYLRQAQFVERTEDKTITNQSFILSSQKENTIDITGFLSLATMIVIDNKDNRPLQIRGITAFQLNRYLTVYLEKGERYTLYCGDPNLPAPQYDLVYFEKNIPENLCVLELPTLENISQQEISPMPQKTNFMETQTFLWLIIGGVGLLLLWICYTMMKEMKKKN